MARYDDSNLKLEELHDGDEDYDRVSPKLTYVEVRAPIDLEEGYTFDAQGPDGSIFPVTVPPGGVTAGQSISVPFHSGVQLAPVGKWRNGLCACCCATCCTPMCCMAFWCCAGHLGQIMTRLNLNWAANPTTKIKAFSTYTILFIVSAICYIMGQPITLIIWIYLIYVGTKTRFYMRQKYQIPPPRCCNRCGALSDCCAVSLCSCCSTIQMARHTHDEKMYPSACCTPTGLRLDAPELPPDVLGAPVSIPIVVAQVV